MQEILITFLLFGLVMVLSSTRSKQSLPPVATKNDDVTNDRHTAQSHPGSEATTPPQPLAETAISSEVDKTTEPTPTAGSTPTIAIMPPLLDVEPEVSLPLATSLSLQEVINSETVEAEPALDLGADSSTIVESSTDSVTQKAKDRDHQDVLAEIAQLNEGHHETTIASLRRYANHANPLVRATVAMTLGELAAKTQGHDQAGITALLNELLQDSNSEVQHQAAIAMGTIQPVNLT